MPSDRRLLQSSNRLNQRHSASGRFGLFALAIKALQRWSFVFGLIALGTATMLVAFSFSDYVAFTLDLILLTCIGAVALQILQGTAGMVSIGHSAFLISGAFLTVWAHRAGVPFPGDIAVGCVGSAIFGLLVALPALRLRALFLALTTLAAFYAALFVATQYQSNVPSARTSGFTVHILFGEHADGDRYWSIVLFVAVAFILWIGRRITVLRTGRALRIIRDHESFAPMFGVSVVRAKLAMFATTSAIVGLEGGLFVYFTGSITTDAFTLALSFQFVAMIVIGGLDRLSGAIVGAVIVTGLPIWMPNVISSFDSSGDAPRIGSNLALVIYGLLVIVFVSVAPSGIAGSFGALSRRIAAKTQRVDEHS